MRPESVFLTQKALTILGVFLFFGGIVSYHSSQAQELDPAKRTELENQLAALEKEASELDTHLQTVLGEKRTLANETETINSEIKRRELEIKRLTLAIRKAAIDIQNKAAGIAELSRKIGKNREALAASLFALNNYDQSNAVT